MDIATIASVTKAPVQASATAADTTGDGDFAHVLDQVTAPNAAASASAGERADASTPLQNAAPAQAANQASPAVGSHAAAQTAESVPAGQAVDATGPHQNTAPLVRSASAQVKYAVLQQSGDGTLPNPTILLPQPNEALPAKPASKQTAKLTQSSDSSTSEAKTDDDQTAPQPQSGEVQWPLFVMLQAQQTSDATPAQASGKSADGQTPALETTPQVAAVNTPQTTQVQPAAAAPATSVPRAARAKGSTEGDTQPAVQAANKADSGNKPAEAEKALASDHGLEAAVAGAIAPDQTVDAAAPQPAAAAPQTIGDALQRATTRAAQRPAMPTETAAAISAQIAAPADQNAAAPSQAASGSENDTVSVTDGKSASADARQPSASAATEPSTTPKSAPPPQFQQPVPQQAASLPAADGGTPAAAASQATPLAAELQVAPHQHDAQSAVTLDTLGLAIAAKSVDGTRHFDIRLDPPELGQVQVHLSVDDAGRAQASLIVDKPQTLALLQRDANNLNRALTDAGLNLPNNGLNFSLREQYRQNGGGSADKGRGRALSVKAVVQTNQTLPSLASLAPHSVRLDIRV